MKFLAFQASHFLFTIHTTGGMSYKLRINLRLKPSTSSEPTPDNHPCTSTGTAKKPNWYQRLKQNDPEGYEAHKKIDAIKSVLWRASLTGDKKKHYNEMSAKRMREYRQRKKEAAVATPVLKRNRKKKNNATTRQSEREKEAKREKERERKRAQRAALSQAKREEINRKRRENPNIKIGLKKFYELRPSHIKTVGTMKYRGCLCEYCTNIDLKVTAINNIAHRWNMPSPLQGVYDVARLSMCLKEGQYHKPACIARECVDCGTSQLKCHLKPIKISQGEKPIKWRKWEKKSIQTSGTTESRQVIITKEGTINECIEELVEASEQISTHLFNASWQNQQFSQLTKNLPTGWVVMVLDLAENYTCKYQDEIQSAHWYHTNATVHPILAYYACPLCGETMEESIVFISLDKSHDFHAVNKFMEIAVSHLKKQLGKTMKQIVRFSDGYGAQYKSKGPFFDISCAEEKYNIKVHHVFYGSRHGKGPSDGESAVVKRQTSMAVLGGKAVINDAKGLFDFCVLNVTKKPVAIDECLHFQRKFFYTDNIDHDRGINPVNLRTVKGTRLIHSVKCIEPGLISTRNLSCFCAPCAKESGMCQNAEYVKEWKQATICDAAKLPSIMQVRESQDSDALEKDLIDATVEDLSDAAADIINDEANLHDICVQDFVAVRVKNTGKKARSDELHVAQVASVLQDASYGLSYMVKMKSSRQHYTWPQGDEVFFIHPLCDIVTKLDAPEPVAVGSRLSFKFDMSQAQKLFNEE
ncbi:uncharacterized protein LOC117102392 [Anneissia japonica]|uniref:uncharacterized protein LOC117102392 n=1 Tax=Anneissia japonica TaxID=1529436 RepID=UPI0014256169|nr:uncharacterized protein LOC117102392 [Anneissia japonica]